MHAKILIPVAIDHEPMVARKLEIARKLLTPGGHITLLTVLEKVSGFVAEFVSEKSENHVSQRILERLDSVKGEASDIETKVIIGKPGVEIARFASEVGIDLIIVGSQSPGATGYMLGSTAARVVRRAPCSVHVLR